MASVLHQTTAKTTFIARRDQLQQPSPRSTSAFDCHGCRHRHSWAREVISFPTNPKDRALLPCSSRNSCCCQQYTLGIFNGFSGVFPHMAGSRAACGRTQHGKEAPTSGARLCFACLRPDASDHDGRSKRWLHVATTAYWADLRDWSSAVGADWTHERDLILEPLRAGECICIRPDCVRGMYHNYKLQRKRDKGGSSNRMAVGQSSPLGRYPSTRFQVSGTAVSAVM